VATISNTAGLRGLATGVAGGTSDISATIGDISGSTVLTVSTQVLNPSPNAVKDNSKAGYYQYGKWTLSAGGYLGSSVVADPNTSPSAIAEWLLDVPAGKYDVWATWVSSASNATNATFSLYDGFTKLGSAQENQQVAPSGAQYGGVFWVDLGSYSFTSGRVTIALVASGANGNIVADGVLMVPSAAPSVISRPGPASGAAPGVVTGSLGTLPPPVTQVSAPSGSTAPSAGRSSPPVKIVSLTSAAPTPVPVKVQYTTDTMNGTKTQLASSHESSRLRQFARHPRQRKGEVRQMR
jgi:hypothetical protein